MNKLLQKLISDQKDVDTKYKPGPFWQKWSILAAKELEKKWINKFPFFYSSYKQCRCIIFRCIYDRCS
jgi:hypothetical protein